MKGEEICRTHKRYRDLGLPPDGTKPQWHCSVSGCEKTNKATAGLCWMHWQRAKRAKDEP